MSVNIIAQPLFLLFLLSFKSTKLSLVGNWEGGRSLSGRYPSREPSDLDQMVHERSTTPWKQSLKTTGSEWNKYLCVWYYSPSEGSPFFSHFVKEDGRGRGLWRTSSTRRTRGPYAKLWFQPSSLSWEERACREGKWESNSNITKEDYGHASKISYFLFFA